MIPITERISSKSVYRHLLKISDTCLASISLEITSVFFENRITGRTCSRFLKGSLGLRNHYKDALTHSVTYDDLFFLLSISVQSTQNLFKFFSIAPLGQSH